MIGRLFLHDDDLRFRATAAALVANKFCKLHSARDEREQEVEERDELKHDEDERQDFLRVHKLGNVNRPQQTAYVADGEWQTLPLEEMPDKTCRPAQHRKGREEANASASEPAAESLWVDQEQREIHQRPTHAEDAGQDEDEEAEPIFWVDVVIHLVMKFLRQTLGLAAILLAGSRHLFRRTRSRRSRRP